MNQDVQSRKGVDTSVLLVTLFANGAPEDLSRSPSLGPVALVRSLEVVEAQERIQRCLQLEPPAEVTSPEGDPPVLVKNRPLEPLDEAVGPCVSRLRSGVPNVEFATHLIECPFELASAIGQHSPQLPASFLQFSSYAVQDASRS